MVLHQAAGFTANALFTYCKFILAPEDPRSIDTFEVQGSHMTAAHMIVKTGLVGAAVALVHVRYELPPVPGWLAL